MENTKIIQTQTVLIQANKTVNISQYGDILDYGFKNIGATDCVLYGNFPLLVGDGLFSVNGYLDHYRNDNIEVTFTGGAGSLLLYLTKVINTL